MYRVDNILFDPITKQFKANINGSLVPIGGGAAGGGGVTKVNTLPKTGEAGKIYYNTSDNTYYVYNNDKFEPIAKQGMPKGTPEITHYSEASFVNGTFVNKKGLKLGLKPNTYYDLSDEIWYSNKDAETPDVGSLTFTFDELNGTDDTTNSYVFRMIIGVNSPNLVFSGVFIPDVTKEVLDNLKLKHEYEFNVFDRYMLVTDVTKSSGGGGITR